MALTAGTKLGPYEIVGLLGAGGMGEVYRAKDTRLERTVAIKILPEALSSDSDRLQRFNFARCSRKLTKSCIRTVLAKVSAPILTLIIDQESNSRGAGLFRRRVDRRRVDEITGANQHFGRAGSEFAAERHRLLDRRLGTYLIKQIPQN
jgi:serine/threonine protein kinase